MIDVTARFPLVDYTYRWLYGSLNEIKAIAIHHTVTPTLPVDASQEQEITQLRTIYNFHVNTRGFGGIGYHGCVFPSGRAYKTAPWDRIGANVARINDTIHGFAAVGDFSDSVPGQRQLEGLAELIRKSWLYTSRQNPIHPHRHWGGTTCPGEKWEQWVPNLAALARGDDMTDEEKARLKALEDEVKTLRAEVDGHSSAHRLIRALAYQLGSGNRSGWEVSVKKTPDNPTR